MITTTVITTTTITAHEHARSGRSRRAAWRGAGWRCRRSASTATRCSGCGPTRSRRSTRSSPRLTERMIGVMHDAEGVGLAATQVGILRRLFVFHDEDEDRVIVNPVVTVRGKETEVDEEGCLSLGPIRMPVERAVEVTLDGFDAEGNGRAPRARGHVGPRRPARARPPRRQDDHRSHGSGVAARGDGPAAPPARPLEVTQHADRRRRDGAVRGGRAGAARRARTRSPVC